MNTINNNKTELRLKRLRFSRLIGGAVFSALILVATLAPVQAQEPTFTKPSLWIGAAGGANLNFYNGTTQRLNESVTTPAAFHPGDGVGLYVAPLVEFYRPKSIFGFMFQAGYDSRRGRFDEILTPCDCPADLSTKLSYVTFEPNLRIAPFRSNFYLFVGPRFAFNMDKSFVYTQKRNPDYPNQPENPPVAGDFSDVYSTLISMQVGAGLDVPLTSSSKQTQVVLAPFVSFHPYMGQAPRSSETWDVTTIRVGAALKFGRSKGTPKVKEVEVKDGEVDFSVNAPRNIPVTRRVRETFPLRNYVYYDEGSTEIPSRYVLLNKGQVKSFDENQLEVFKPKSLSGRSDRQMIVYYNVLNILGNRMANSPSTAITLVGSSELGPEDAKLMAQSSKNYLVNTFGIDASRISIEGRDRPKFPSGELGGTNELELLQEGNRRVSIESRSPTLLMEFQSGPNAPLKPVEIVADQEAPFDSYVAFNADGASNAYSSWALEVKDKDGKVQKFGPYNDDKVYIPGKSILGTRTEGDYIVTMVGTTKSGKTIRKETPVNMVLWVPPANEEGIRYSIIYEFNESKAIAMYEKYLTDIVTPKIPKNGTVIIHGYTDVIGDKANNEALSLSRANDVKQIIASALSKAGRKDVKMEVHGFGEDQSQFSNGSPEERSYNRTVIIDIIPSE